jgi:hypothetical protein
MIKGEIIDADDLLGYLAYEIETVYNCEVDTLDILGEIEVTAKDGKKYRITVEAVDEF